MKYNISLTIASLFRKQAALTPQNTAVVFKDKSLTYSELDRISDNIAAELNRRGVGKEDVVGLLLNRSELLPVCALGVLKSGAAYLPLDPTYPNPRLEFMLKDSEAKLLVRDDDLAKNAAFDGDVIETSALPGLPNGKPTGAPTRLGAMIVLYTSGSTGTPKGVILEHYSVRNYCLWYKKYTEMNGKDAVLAYASFGFDANMMDMYPTLISGAALHILPEELRLDLDAIDEYITTHGVTVAFMTTQIARQFTISTDNKSLRLLSAGGEKLVPFDVKASYKFVNLYGPTECSVAISGFTVDRRYDIVPVGKPVDNCSIYILDENGGEVPAGETGEVCAAGVPVGRGYLKRPELTEKVFVKGNSFNDDPDYSVIYHTGDIGRILPDGNLEIVGRKDAQVKIRGFRIELTEVEEAVRRFAGVKDATVADYEYESGGKYICAYIVGDDTLDKDALKAFISAEKPPYMVPSVIMQIDAIPLNQNGKVNKRALPKPQAVFEDVIPPSTDLQKKLFDILAGVVGIDAFGVNTDLTEAGLSSIGAVKFISALSKELGASVKFAELADSNNILKLEKLISNSDTSGTGKFELRSEYPLTKTQMGVYLECLKSADSLAYNLPLLLSVDASIDAARLANAVKTAAANHPSINAHIVLRDGEPFQTRDDGKEVVVDVFGVTAAEWTERKTKLTRPFDLFKPPLYRFEIYKTPERVYLFADIHHIICDGSSYAILIDDIGRAYKGETLEQEELTGFDLALAEEINLRGEHYQKAKAYYETAYDGADESPLPPRDMDGPKERSAVYTRFEKGIDPAKADALAAKLNVTPNALFTGLFGYVMSALTAREDYTFSTIYNGRSQAGVTRVVGMLVKTMPVRVYTNASKALSAYLTEVKRQLLDNMRHDLYSFAEVSRAKGVTADVMFIYQGADFTDFKIADFETVEELMDTKDAQAPITIHTFIEKGVYKFVTEYRADMYSETFLSAILDALAAAVNSAPDAETLGDISLLSDRAVKLLAEMNDTDYPCEFEPVAYKFAAQAKKNPDKTAVTAVDGSLTYGELLGKVEKAAAALLPYAANNGIIALDLSRTTDVYVARQAILRAGGAFLPIDALYPQDRVKYIIEDSGAKAVIYDGTTREMVESVRGGLPCFSIADLLAQNADTAALANAKIKPDDLAYCIYTSGSTGNPKGVMIEQRNLCNFVTHSPKNNQTSGMVGKGNALLAIASISFDVSVLNEYVTLCNGLSVVLPSDEEIHNPLALRDCIVRNNVDMISCSPSFLTNIVDMPEMTECLKAVTSYDVAGEPFPGALYDKITAIRPDAYIMNGYGPTEITIISSTDVVKSAQNVTIGVPEVNVRCYAVTAGRKILPPGFKGELCIVGAGVGRGYVGLPERTAAAFIELTEPDGRKDKAYLSGDLAVVGFDKKIICHGRKDNQIKLRGFRVELGEIENAINAWPSVKTSVAVVKENDAGQYLAAYFTATEPVNIESLKAEISKTLTYYMVPNVYLQMDKLPLTSNGKVDKRALPEITYERGEQEYVKPATAVEKELCDKFAAILGQKRVGAADNFFEIGGTSLTASKLAMFAASKNYPFFYADIFKHPTARELAALVSSSVPEGGAAVKGFGADFDYTAIDGALSRNNLCNLANGANEEPLGDILLTGATGFLGIHILREFLENYGGKVYCLLRASKKGTPPETRLKSMLMYYFDSSYDELFEKRVVCIDGDMTSENDVIALEQYAFDAVINCAANVKHFSADDSIMRVNYNAVTNLIKLCRNTARKLVHISTYSVAGEAEVCPVHALTEQELYFGQIIENEYIKSKFMAEYAIMSAVAGGKLKAKIMRAGNLSPRSSDGEFQINFMTNGFMRKLRGFRAIKAFPYGLMNEVCEFSPIDDTAKAILLLAETDDKLTVFAPFNNHTIFMSDVITAMRKHGFDIDIVADEEFKRRVSDFGKTENAEKAAGIIAYDTAEERTELPSDNTFTTNVLYRLGFKWPITDDGYLENAIIALDTLSFFD